MQETGRYATLALQIVPKKKDRGREELRKDIATILEREVEMALAKQREQQFPELAALTKSLKDKEAAVEKKEAALLEAFRTKEDAFSDFAKQREQSLSNLEKAVYDREVVVEKREKLLASFCEAFEDYAAWISGEGSIDENGQRFRKLKTAVEQLKKEKV